VFAASDGECDPKRFTRYLEADYGSLLTVTGWICPRTREWIEHHSRVGALLSRPRDADDVLF
jgi:hypothetical protein